MGNEWGVAELEAEESNGDEREKQLTLIVKQYSEHPQVKSAIIRLKNKNVVRKDPEDLMGRYLQEIGQYNLLTENDEIRLFTILEKGLKVYQGVGTFENISEEDERAMIEAVIAYQTVHVSNLRLVVDVAKRYFYPNTAIQEEDHIQEGALSLSTAIKKFDLSKGFKFSTYATSWIRQGITRAIGEKSRAIRMPIHMHTRYVKASYVIKELTQKLDRQPTIEEIAKATGEPVKDVKLMLERGGSDLASLDEQMTEDGGTLGDTIEEPVSPIDMRMEELDSRAYVTRMFSAPELSTREQFVLSARLGYSVDFLRGIKTPIANGKSLSYEEIISAMERTDDGILTLEEVGELFGITRERIRQIESAGFKKIRAGYFKG